MFFFKQKAAYGIEYCLGASEMFIRARPYSPATARSKLLRDASRSGPAAGAYVFGFGPNKNG